MALIVQKFGGSSVANAERLRNVAGIITDTYKAGNDVVVIVSAQGDTTDDLIEKAKEVNPSPSKREMDVLLSVGDVFMDVIHEYPDLTVHLTLFNATIAEGEPQKLEHNDIQWIIPSEIPNYDFCPADEEILKALIDQE